ncbi:MAG: exonuclease SbcCD subunit D [Aquificaceae bacterium]
MRVLHASDLHAGKSLGRLSRNEDLYYALNQVLQICRDEDVQILLLAGDIYDKPHPDSESQNLILEFLTKATQVVGHIVLISGNHDSYDLIKSYKNLKRLSNIHVYDRPCRNPKDCILKVGELTLACLPYPSERLLTHLSEEVYRSYTEKVSTYLRKLSMDMESSKYNILLSHMMVESARVSGSEKQSTIGEFYAIKPEHIPSTFDYVALGHIHRHQKVEKASTKAYYSGSLYQIDFSEKEMDKYVNLVTLEDDVKVRPIKLSLKRQLYEIRINQKDNFYEKLKEVEILSGLFKVILDVDIKDTSLNIKRNELEKVLGDRLVKLEVQFVGHEMNQEVSNEGKIDLLELYQRYYKHAHASDIPDDIKNEFFKVFREAEHEAHTP